ncbi:MAG: VOC family protein [Gallionella sp.]
MEHGGKVLVAPRSLAGRGEVALLADPEGALFAVIHSASGDPLDYLAEDNQWMWIELWAKDPKTMATFYSGLAGYEVNPTPMSNGKTAYQLASGGYARCNIIPTPEPGHPSAWLPFLRVHNVKASVVAVVQAGGRVIVEPDPEVRAGTTALIIDPTGAAIGLVQGSEDGKP